MSEPPRIAQYFPAFASPHYRALWLASAVSAISMWAMIMARAWLALDLADNGFSVGAVTFAAMAPWVLAPLGGSLADRFDRVRLGMIGRSGQMVLAWGLAALVFSGELQVWHLVCFAFASGLCWTTETSSQAALLPNTLDPRALLNGITLVSLSNFGSRLVGPLVGAPLLAGLGPGWIFVMAAVLYIAAVWLTSRVGIRSSGELRIEGSVFTGAKRGLAEAFRYVGANPQIRLVIALVAAHCLFTMSFDALLPILADHEFDGGSGLFSGLLMGLGGGALVGSLALSFVTNDQLRGSLFLVTGIASGLSLFVVGVAPTPAWAIVGTTLVGASQAGFVALGSALIQSVVPDGIRGRVMSLYALFGGGVMALMIFSNGTAADVVNVRVLLWAPGLTFAALLIGWALVHADFRRIVNRGVLYLGRDPNVVAVPVPGAR